MKEPIKDDFTEGEIVTFHGGITHSISQCDTCEDCIKNAEDFKRAKEDGTLDKLLKTRT